MKTDTTKTAGDVAAEKLFDNWFDPVEASLRVTVRGFIETMIEEELDTALSRPRYGRRLELTAADNAAAPIVGHRHGHRMRSLTGTFGPTQIAVPRARIIGEDGKTAEWKSKSLRAYQRRTKQAEALIAGAYLSGTNTRRVRRALSAVFKGAVSKDVVSRTWRKVKGDWDAWNVHSLKDEPIVRLILDGTVVRARLDKKATSISLLVAMGVRQDGQKVLLAVKNMGGESEAAWRALLDDLVNRGLKTPELVIVDGAAGLEKALTALWSDMPVQRCTVHKHRNLLVHAPARLHEEISADYNDMIYADSKPEIEARRKAFIRKWRLKCRAVADSVEEAGDKLFTFTRFPKSQWKSIRTSNAIERLHEEFKRRIKTQTVLPSAETAAMLFWALLAPGQITMRKVDGWQSLAEKPSDQIIDLAA
ncbi:MAG TPA: IS256 family transposase [Stellaceae bacterium]|nr:IS256 family transposase [Stellaceae bacterium]